MPPRKKTSETWSDFASSVKSNLETQSRCGISRFIEGGVLPNEHRSIILAVIEDKGFTASAIHRALVDRVGDKAPSRYTIAAHRRGDCSCKRGSNGKR